jgi:hypothetical protein
MTKVEPFHIIYKSILFLRVLEKKDIKGVAFAFGKFSNQLITEQMVKEWRMTGLGNEYFLTSDFLNQYGLKNLIQFIQEK